jgi:multiple sugar transport system substrate-binding protein
MWGDAWVKTIAAIEAGSGPDFQFSIPDLLLTSYLLDALIPVTEIVEELDKEYGFIDNQIAIYYHDGEYWGVPIMTMVMLLTYRPSLLEKYVGTSEPPKNWEEYLEYAEKLTDPENNVYGVGLGGGINLMVTEQAYIFMANTGAKFFDEEGNVIFNSPETIQALEMYRDLFQYTPPGAEAWSWGEQEMNTMVGITAMTSFFPAVQRRFYVELDTDDYAAVAHPYPADGQPGTLTYPNEIHIYKWTAERPGHLEATYDFIRFIMRPDINYMLTAGQDPGVFYPTTIAAQEAPEFWEDPIISRYEEINRTAIEVLKDATLYGFEYGHWVNLGIGDITGANILAEVVNRIVAGGMTVEDAVEWGHNEMEKYSVPVGSK